MSGVQWVLKRQRYDGSETIVSRYSNESNAQDDADLMNDAYQSAQYYVEQWDPARAGGYSNDNLVHSMVAKINEAG